MFSAVVTKQDQALQDNFMKKYSMTRKFKDGKLHDKKIEWLKIASGKFSWQKVAWKFYSKTGKLHYREIEWKKIEGEKIEW